MANIILSKESSNKGLKSYFESVLKLSQSDNEFPINLEDVWMLAYANKGNAIIALKKNFIEGIDFLLLQNEKQKQGSGGHNEMTCMLSIPCLEYFIARKIRPVFEVYRQVFHKVANKKVKMYTEKEVKRHLLDVEIQVREACESSLRLQIENYDLKSKVRALSYILGEEQERRMKMLIFIEKRQLTEELMKSLV